MPRKKILLVDDSNTVLMMERMILNKGSYDLVTAKDGSEAVERAFAERPDLILLDVIMPHMDGVATLEALRHLPATAAIPVIFMTAKVRREERDALMKLGAIGVIAKPFNPMTLAAEVRRLWDQRGV